jgi:hypothetical protein
VSSKFKVEDYVSGNNPADFIEEERGVSEELLWKGEALSKKYKQQFNNKAIEQLY